MAMTIVETRAAGAETNNTAACGAAVGEVGARCRRR